MSNNKEIICKLIKAKNQEANSYTDQTCYNAAYCYGYVDGAVYTTELNEAAVAPGTAKITVTAGDLTATCIVRCRWEESKPSTGGGSSSSSGNSGSCDSVSTSVSDAALNRSPPHRRSGAAAWPGCWPRLNAVRGGHK